MPCNLNTSLNDFSCFFNRRDLRVRYEVGCLHYSEHDRVAFGRGQTTNEVHGEVRTGTLENGYRKKDSRRCPSAGFNLGTNNTGGDKQSCVSLYGGQPKQLFDSGKCMCNPKDGR